MSVFYPARFLKIFRSVLIILLFSIFMPGPALSAHESLTIGLLPEMNVFKQMQRFQPLADYLTEKLGIKVKLTMLSRYGNIDEHLRTKEVDASFLGSFTGTLAISQLGVVPLARPVNLDGTSSYLGHIFVRKDSQIRNVADMRGKTMAFVELATTAGYLFPLAYLRQNGINDYKTYFRKYFFTGSHDAAIDAVLSGEADVGAAKNTIYEFYLQENPQAGKELVILASSPKVPSNGLCVRADLDPDLQVKLKELLLNLVNEPRGLEVLNALHALKFVDTGKEDYQPTLDMASEAGINLKEYRYINE